MISAAMRCGSVRCGSLRLIRSVSCVPSDPLPRQGYLRGFDQTVNLILDECHERVFSQSAPVEQVALGLYIIRGDNVSADARTNTHARRTQRAGTSSSHTRAHSCVAAILLLPSLPRGIVNHRRAAFL